MRVVIDEKGLNESNPEAGTSLTVRGNIIATAVSAPILDATTIGSTGTNTYRGSVRVIATVPSAYPYTTLSTDNQVAVDSTVPRIILLASGTTELEQVIIDAGDLSLTNPITVGLANALKKLNGVVNGTVVIATNGALRGFKRDANGNWRGGV